MRLALASRAAGRIQQAGAALRCYDAQPAGCRERRPAGGDLPTAGQCSQGTKRRGGWLGARRATRFGKRNGSGWA